LTARAASDTVAGVRRLIATLVMLALVVATAAPALAACRRVTAQKSCCCAPAAAHRLCPPDCCARALPDSTPIAPSTEVRGLAVAPPPVSASILPDLPPSPTLVRPTARSFVRLHERAAPRRPLRI
jgi:hypothetical protein